MTTTLDLNNPRSGCDIKKVRALEFGLFSPEHIMRMSVCNVTSADLYDNGVPKENGLNDPRMGTTDYRIPCASCNMDCKACPGHFGHIQLCRPVYHVGYLRVVLYVLRCVCFGCSRLLCASDAKLQVLRSKAPRARFNRVVEMCKTKKRCDVQTVVTDGSVSATEQGGCGCTQPKFTRDGIGITVQLEAEVGPEELDGEGRGNVEEDSKRPLQAEEALAVLKRIPEEHLKLMGFDPSRNHPAWMIVTVMPVPPPAVRPYVQFGTDRSEDDLTLKLLDIVKTNLQLHRQRDAGATAHMIEDNAALLQYHVATLVNNDLPGVPVATTRSKKPIKSLRQRLKGKEGRLRGNLMGKRVDFSARTVITGDPNLYIDEVGVPKSVAMTLTFAETVTPMNLDALKKLVANGPHAWPGARFVIRSDGGRFDLRHTQGHPAAQQLEIGDRVERHMQDGDYVLFNRQPSLHKMSIMGHKARILPWSTFRLNLSVTSPYNADFDGDEMNLHLAQSHETRAEVKHLMIVPKQVVSPQGNKPVMGIVQDSLLGLAKFTRRDCFLDRGDVMMLLSWIPYWDGHLPLPALLKPQPLWTGKQLFSKLLQFDGTGGAVQINLQRDGSIRLKNDNENLSENDGRVIIRNNELLAGIVCKRIAGASGGSLIHTLWLEAGPEQTRLFLSCTQRVVNNWLVQHGFTVGCADIVASPDIMASVNDTLEESAAKVNELIQLAQKGQLETQPGKSLLQSFEARVNQELNQAREAAGKVAAESLDESNNIMAMVNSGSKGSTINISQIMACVGQQNVEGKRIPFGFKDRSLPHYVKHDYGPASRGFVQNSYLTGLTPQELFFHAMGGREGIIDTACKTSETGYIQRRLIKAMEDVLVAYDKTVRTSTGEIVQFLYGDDGMAGEFVEDQILSLMRIDLEELESTYRHDCSSHDYGKPWIPSEKIRSEIRLSFEHQSVLEQEFQRLHQGKLRLCQEIFPDGDIKQHLPINVSRLIQFAKCKFPHDQFREQSPVEIVRQVEALLSRLQVIQATSESDNVAQEAQANATLLLHINLRAALASRKLMERDKLGPQAVQWLLGEIEQQFHRAQVHPGEAVGAMAAQSIGEPATQMTLNTFHFAGVGSKNVTLGVPRLKELINVAKTVKTPSLTVFLNDDISTDQEAAKTVQAHLEHTTLERVTSHALVVYDPHPSETIVEADREWVREYYEFPDEEQNEAQLGPFVLRLQLIEKAITDKGLTMKEIGTRICAEFPDNELDCIWTDDNSEDLVVRIRLKIKKTNDTAQDGAGTIPADEEEQRLLTRLMTQYLASITLRGIPGIQKVYMREEKQQVYDLAHGTFQPKAFWVLDTDGCNLSEVLAQPDVDPTRTTSNDVTEVLRVLGVEAVRRALLRELRAVISFDGSYVNYRHLSTLCDVMCQSGSLMSITRNGINRGGKACLSKCSFEETVEVLMAAAAFGETDFLRGVTENIMFGQLGPFGTGLCDLVIDESKLHNAGYDLVRSTHALVGEIGSFGGQLASIGLSSPTAVGSENVDFMLSPFSPTSPLSPSHVPQSPLGSLTGSFSPMVGSPTSPFSPLAASPIASPLPGSPTGAMSCVFSPIMHPASPLRGSYSPSSPTFTTGSSMLNGSYSPTSPSAGVFSVSSPSYSPTSPVVISPTSPMAASPTSPMGFSPTSPGYSPTSPMIAGGFGASPTSPHYGRLRSAASPQYSPRSPVMGVLSPSSPINAQSPGAYSLTSPNYSPTSPVYAADEMLRQPLSPDVSMTSPRYDPQDSIAKDSSDW